tara:strand:+ start:5982 stop:6923 length:942 start_codon:yes stop_codon:yes gene_type:complete
MISERMYKTTINVEQPCKFLSSESNVKDRLDKTFTNRCFYGALILEVLRVEKVSMCRIITSNHRANGVINVCFTARALNYRKGDIIPDVHIEITNTQVAGTSQYAMITLEKSPNNRILVNGQTIPVIVGDKILYNTNSSSINIMGSILTPVIMSPIYHMSGTLDSKIYNTVSNLIDNIKEQDMMLKTEQSKIFLELMNPKVKSATKKGGAAKLDNVLNIITTLEKAKNVAIDFDGYWQKDITQPAEGLNFVVTESEPSSGEFIDVTVVIGIQEMIYQSYALREGIIKLGQTYDKERMAQLSNVWTLMKKSKLV